MSLEQRKQARMLKVKRSPQLGLGRSHVMGEGRVDPTPDWETRSLIRPHLPFINVPGNEHSIRTSKPKKTQRT